ncbi:OmpA family protein [Shewanella sp. NIFS-20-20]|uniref:OmpA family protein n=1 Tax=Shewanella sp. NIFS-20-20 TaxID=2853806 RepID=UPI001C46DF32|nr:OmpA family protein [Shewanella sp. NIFS-20-20]MBV7316742.1 OmpA family protein [Shewanella sp. NIFS-20-20]
MNQRFGTIMLMVVLPLSVGAMASGPIDTDGDAVADHYDACPGTPVATPVYANGCIKQSHGQLCIATDDGAWFPADCQQNNIPPILFSFAKDDVRFDQWPQLAMVSELLSQYPDIRIILNGHADIIGLESKNQALSEARAQQVRYVLSYKFGFHPNRIEIRGFGSRLPVAENVSEQGRQANRRVDYQISFGLENNNH